MQVELNKVTEDKNSLESKYKSLKLANETIMSRILKFEKDTKETIINSK